VPPDLVADFALQYLDAAHDPVWRDYCLQFLSAGHEKLAASTHPDAPAACTAAVEVLRFATSERTDTLSGTALLGLDTIARRDPAAVPATDVVTLAVAIAADPNASDSCRVTALRVAALNAATNALPAARDLARSGSTELLRQAAVATLGDLGTPSDRALLASLARDRDPHVASTAQRALSLLDRRPATNPPQ